MKLLTRKILRTSVALTLILALVGLGALDATLCRGSDGHFGTKTIVISCCESAKSEVSSTNLFDPNQATFLDSVGEGSSCEDTPLIQGALIVNAASDPISCPAPFSTIHYSMEVGLTELAPTPLFCTESTLCRLRSTTLLI